MNVSITLEEEFKRQAKHLIKKYRSFREDLVVLQDSLIANPFQGISLGGGVRKVRMAIASKGKGKSGSARVLTLVVMVSEDADVTLLTIYDKSEIGNVSDEYIKWLVEQHGKTTY
ncbi:MAG: addiction module toxin RelE [Prevotella sp.]|jgi:hypothetical protein|nr:addiction module toxin RelE [Prevotella sp.]